MTRDKFISGSIQIAIVALIAFGFYSCVFSDEAQKQADRERLAAETPHVIREAQGCKVFAFTAHGAEHYFAACADAVTTERTYSENCGKGCTKQKSEIIITRKQ